MVRFRDALRAAGILLLAGSTTLCFSFVLRSVDVGELYEQNFKFVPGPYIANRLRRIDAPSDTCILIGASVLREGVDDVLLAEGIGREVANIATTGGSSAIDVIDIQAAILQNTGKQYGCIIVGMNSFYLNDFDENSYELIMTEYLSQLTLNQLAELSVFWPEGVLTTGLIKKLLLPFGAHSKMLDRTWRHAIYRGRLLLSAAQAVSLSAYEVSPGELLPAKQYQYDGKRSDFERAKNRTRELIEENDMTLSESYQSAKSREAAIRALGRLAQSTKRLLVVEMPVTSVYKPAIEASEQAFVATMSEIDAAELVRCEVPVDKERAAFFDTAHLNRAGREDFTRVLSLVLQANFAAGQYVQCAKRT